MKYETFESFVRNAQSLSLGTANDKICGETIINILESEYGNGVVRNWADNKYTPETPTEIWDKLNPAPEKTTTKKSK